MFIGDKYKIESEPMNIVLYKKHIVKKKGSKNIGEESWEVIGYYSTIQHVLIALVDLSNLPQQALHTNSNPVKLKSNSKP